MIPRLGATLLLVLASATPLLGQWSFDIPGVPRAGIARQGSSQGRFEFEGSWAKSGGTSGDSTVFATRLGFGYSWRIASVLEFGFDISLADGHRVSGIDPADAPDAREDSPTALSVTGVYGLLFGLKLRPLSYVDLEGNGIELAVGAGYQPRIDPLVHYESLGDSSATGGILGGADELIPPIEPTAMFMAAFSYRHPRWMGDFAVVYESVDETAESFLPQFPGFSAKLGVKYRLTHGFAVGASYWGGGAPPWRGRPNTPLISSEDSSDFGLILSFGGTPEKALDLMISSPTGSFGESVSLYLSAR